LRGQLFWFDIPAGKLFACNVSGGDLCSWSFGEPASAAGWVDEKTLVIATASGLQRFDIASGARDLLVEMEPDNPVTRANDGRIGPDGSFWIGTMGRNLEPHAGAYYRFKHGKLSRIIESMSIPNATCFAPDGRTAYIADTTEQVIWRWPLDASGNPLGERIVHIDLRPDNVYPDGAVCDVEGYLWNAQYGSSRIVRYAPDGSTDTVIALPVSRPTCPAFGGKDLRTLYVTSACENLSPAARATEPDAGKIIVLEVDVAGIPETRLKL
jgi:sugar lactone lactonase YvrE